MTVAASLPEMFIVGDPICRLTLLYPTSPQCGADRLIVEGLVEQPFFHVIGAFFTDRSAAHRHIVIRSI